MARPDRWACLVRDIRPERDMDIRLVALVNGWYPRDWSNEALWYMAQVERHMRPGSPPAPPRFMAPDVVWR